MLSKSRTQISIELIIQRFSLDHLSYGHINYKETLMNKDQVKGHVKQAEGKVKEVTGRILDDNELELEGNVQKNAGKVQTAVGDLKEELKKDS
jgi:uncharacterized protein YjbJ (UPF0337 family)